LGKLLVLIGALAATFLLFAGVAMRVALRAREVEVPPLVGSTVNDASKALADLGLGLRIDTNQRSDEKVPAGYIAQQDPPAGVRARQPRTIRVWVSSGVRTTALPILVGRTERTALIDIEQAGLEVRSVSEFRSPDYATDTVVSQDPPPTTRAPRVALLLNRGEDTSYVMPDLIGVDATLAAETLRARGFHVTISAGESAVDQPPGTIVRHEPAGGLQVRTSDKISIEASR
jgi:serine/threonine-protein kinase